MARVEPPTLTEEAKEQAVRDAAVHARDATGNAADALIWSDGAARWEGRTAWGLPPRRLGLTARDPARHLRAVGKSMRMTLIALMVTVAAAAAAAQTTEEVPDGRSWLEVGQLFDEFAELFGYAPVDDVREREAPLNKAEAALEKRATTVQADERAVAQHEAALAQRETNLANTQRIRIHALSKSRIYSSVLSTLSAPSYGYWKL